MTTSPPSNTIARLEAQLAALQAENATLRVEAVFLRQLIDQAPALMIVRDREQRLILANQLAAQSAGLPLDQLLGQTPAALYPPQQAQEIGAEHTAILSSGRPLYLDRASLHDSQRHASGIKFPLVNDHGQLYAVATIISDVTDLKLADEQIARDALILANINDSVIMTDRDGIVTYWNAGATRIFGWSEEEMVGRHLSASYAAEQRPGIERLMADILAGATFDGEWQDQRKGGAAIWIDARTSRMVDAAGQVIGILGIARDITARKQAEARFQSYARRLAALRVIEQAILKSHSLPDLLQTTLTQITALLPDIDLHISVFDLAQGFATSLPAPDGQLEPAGRYPLPPDEILAAFRQGRPIHIADLEPLVQADPHYAVLMHGRRRALLAVPMVADDQVVGALKIGRPRPGLFSDDEVAIAQDLAAALAVGIAQDQLRKAETQARQIAQTISAANLALTQYLALSDVINTLLDNLLLLVPYHSAVVYLLEDETTLRPYAMRGYDLQGANTAVHASFDLQLLPITARVVTGKQSLRIDDIQRDPEWIACPGTDHCHSWLGVPLIAGDRVIGLYSLDNAEPGFFSAEHLRHAELLAPQAVIAIENARLFEDLTQSRTQLQRLSLQIVQVQEAERAHLARELHDEIGQLLTGLHLSLESDLRADAASGRPQICAALETCNQMIQRVRELSLKLSPPMLAELGLAETLHWYAGRFTEQTKIRVDVRHNNLDRIIRADLALSAYRIIQEALTNVARHAGVTTVTVQAWTTAEILALQVIDAGRGFDPSALNPERSIGLTGIRERARLMGGQLSIITAPGQGVRIMAEIPLVEPSTVQPT